MKHEFPARFYGAIARVVCLALAVVVLAPAPSALAHRSGWKSDNRDHAWCYTASTQGKPVVRDAMLDSMNYLASRTVMTENGPNTCTDLTDVVFFEGSAGGARGLWRCVDPNFTPNPNVCRSADVIIDKDVIEADTGPYELNVRKTACHEVGHSVGLDHHSTPTPVDCMVSGAVGNTGITYRSDHVQAIADLH